MKEVMTIQEGLKKLKHILSVINKNSTRIQEYSSQPSETKPKFETMDEQKKEIKSLAQSNEDLILEYMSIHSRVCLTNLTTTVDINGKVASLNDWLNMRRKLAMLMKSTYLAMNDKNGATQMMHMRNGGTDMDRYYDERTKQNKIREWDDLYHGIDGRLEVINATTNLVELPEIQV